MKNIPNILSGIRLLCVPLFIFLFLNNQVIPAAIVFIFASATDVLDGWLARHFNWSSKLGRILDPLADKLLQFSVLLCLTIRAGIRHYDTFPIVLIVLIIFTMKELLMMTGGIVVFRVKKDVVVSSWYGKLATVIIFFITLTLLLLPENLIVSLILSILLICAICFALIMYYIKIFRGQYGLKSRQDMRSTTKK